MTYGWMCGGVGIDHHNGAVIMFGPSYGRLTHWSEEGAHSWTKSASLGQDS